MPSQYRLTKYNPKYRNELGVYIKSEWTCFRDIGKSFNNHILSLKEYLEIEKLYVSGIRKILDKNKISVDNLKLRFWKNEVFYFDDNLVTKNLYPNMNLGDTLLNEVLRLMFRQEIMGVFLEGSGFYIDISGDSMYVFLGFLDMEINLDLVNLDRLFLEPCAASYEFQNNLKAKIIGEW